MMAATATMGFFTGLDEAFAEGLEGEVVFSGGERGHEDEPFDFGSSSASSATSVGLAALFEMRGDAGQRGVG